MRLLAFDTSTEVLSVAVADGDQVWQHTGAGGAQASATLLPVILGLLEDAGLALWQLDAIAFGSGPGSFTGLRTACSVAQGLAFGSRAQRGSEVPVLPVDTLLAVAEEARVQAGVQQVVALLDARMDEVYSASYRHDGGRWQHQGDFELLKPEAVQLPAGYALAGNAVAVYGDRLPTAAGGGPVHVPALPTAAAMLRLAPELLAQGLAVAARDALPRYIRDKVARTTAERLADKAQALAAAPLTDNP